MYHDVKVIGGISNNEETYNSVFPLTNSEMIEQCSLLK